ncbi:hypothetical protein MKW94_001971 [Papaver nudicaule]|uniref:Uncharacterized protein n=1 Tax=Papaver nudicaule TaxID=74823 RepID=A0AA41VY07_PAPNU|nr:hypothetical protein [Papaver nudicaule]
MSSSIFNKLAYSRRIVSTVYTVPHALSKSLASSSIAKKVPVRTPFFRVETLENGPRPPVSTLLTSLYQPGHQPLDFNVGQRWSHTQFIEAWHSVHAILSDYLVKHIGLDSLYCDAMFWKLLTSDKRFKDHGVVYKPAPVPDKNEWKASWSEEGKPSWLGTVPTKADDHFYYTALIDGFVDEKGGKGGYAVIFIDSYARPKVAVVGYSPQASLFLCELQGIKVSLQLALDNGFSSNIMLATRSKKVQNLFGYLSELEDLDSIHRCEQDHFKYDDGDDSHVCLACEGFQLSRHLNTKMEDFEILYPVIKEILELRIKLGRRVGISPNLSVASAYLSEHYGILSIEEMVVKCYGEHQFHEMVVKPTNFPEKLEDILYDDCFKGYRHYGQDILEEIVPGHNTVLSAPEIFTQMRRKINLVSRGTDLKAGLNGSP